MAQNLSIPLAFACLLHLANEKVGRTGKWRVFSTQGPLPVLFVPPSLGDLVGLSAIQNLQLQAPGQNLEKGCQIGTVAFLKLSSHSSQMGSTKHFHLFGYQRLEADPASA